ncbi:bifunctional DNA-binding transcriptional regulator/O6-methylguanine-DNA methyltransferase Ada [Robbsia sp. Bb-Pol-6]|uniref:Bifunctional DNA-binding transcriptional regulator/O6-methylguanine-DNA methyltransferase Ada n=1 Tax=Robbsia betulipollinis TaxID=2981849 RepID=A0ABT3ZRE5_9BURK|nr:bifunctional DNA-binding transcriptional regulator/O6-methylguanine-DNA methyltransferase Ada [Robbsia betulipollinis]MCY0388520.1 bifunctional DNA-binding transcriptional regulator/O6-methylguanine-DNA methyltransferase Ada [Robbsia betulipollinis]
MSAPLRPPYATALLPAATDSADAAADPDAAGTAAADELRWAAVQARDHTADALFVYGVRTTGVYGRPSGSARLPRRENVVFFASAAAAEAAGYRPSRRAAADRTARDARQAALVTEACRRIDAADVAPCLATLATHAGLSPGHFHRLFKAVTGLTPSAYAAAARRRRVHAGLPVAGSVTRVLYDAGFASNSRFYAATDHMLGMTPSNYRAGGANTTIRFAIGACSLGAILVAQSPRGICAILLGDDPDRLARDLQDQFREAALIGADASFEHLVALVVGFVETPALGLDLPLDIRGTVFQERVWRALAAIPPGQTASYADIAARIGAPTAVRAVARACGANRLAVAIPCHRVVRADGALSGYRWGVERKQALLVREAEPLGIDNAAEDR